MIQISFVTIHIYGLLVGIAVYISYLFIKKRSYLYNFQPQEIENIFFLTLPFVLIGARIYHVLDKWNYYSKHLTEIPAVWNGGLGLFGGLVGGLLGILIFTKLKHQNTLKLLDLFLPAFAIAQSIGRWGNFINQEAFGPPTNLPWGIFIKPENRPPVWLQNSRFHPTFLYESIPLLLIGMMLLSLERKKGRKSGQITAFYCILYGTTRFITEFFRFDTATVGSFKTAQILSITIIILGILILRREKIWKTLKKEQNS